MTLKLTKLGEIANIYGVLTPPEFWRMLLNRADSIAEQGGDWQLMLEEISVGCRELIRAIETYGFDGLSET